MTIEEVLERARSCIDRGIRYRLGRGGMDPRATLPGRECDCSGFVCWCLGISRRSAHPFHANNGGWLNTTEIVRDARVPGGVFTQLERPQIGALMVFPWKKDTPGHVGIISGMQSSSAVIAVIHCSPRNGRSDSVAETGPTAFVRPDTIYAWYTGVASGGCP